MPAATYPGTVTPLRGLQGFAESERDVLFGRDRERDELARLVTGEGFRAGMLYGEPGVGKTSLVRAGLIPHLRDHGVMALACDDILHPIDSFARVLGQVSHLSPADQETPIGFLSRVVSDAKSGLMYLFLVDDADVALAAGGDKVVSELAELFTRVVSRSGGRARFLFACSSERVHLFGGLERRTGSLFPPTNRYELHRFHAEVAADVLDRTLALAGVASDPQLARAIAAGLGQAAGVLPADLQIAALAVRELGLAGPADLARLGGAGELESAWLHRIAAATGNQRAALRLLAALAPPTGAIPLAVEWVAAEAQLEPEPARQALSVLTDRGATRAVPVHGSGEFHFALGHEILARRVREIAAPARLAARRSHELLGSKAERGHRLGAREWFTLWREGLAPGTPAERAVLDRTRRFFKRVAGAIAALPIVVVILAYVLMSGRYYLDVAPGPGGTERVVVRLGRPALGFFDFLPRSPRFGSIIADTGFSRAMIDPAAWREIEDHGRRGSLAGGGFAGDAVGALRPGFRLLLRYAESGDAGALEELAKTAKDPDELAALLTALRPIARGEAGEVGFIERALLDASPAVQSAALQVAAAAARRKPGAYDNTLAQSLASTNAELRRLAFSAVRTLPDERAQALYRQALAGEPDAGARRELQAVVTGDVSADTPSARSAITVLASRSLAPATRDRARALLRRAFATDPTEAAAAAAELAASERAAPDDRVLALALLYDRAPEASYKALADPIAAALGSKDEAVHAAALPLYARTNPTAAAGDLAVMLQNAALSPELKVAMALAWGEVARGKDHAAAQVALEGLIKDPTSKVRAAAAEAYGQVGRAAQETLVKMVKNERADVALGAARGLAHSAEVGASSGEAVMGIYQLWKRKGKARRDAAQVFAELARSKPNVVDSYLESASRTPEDAELHPIGVAGLCNALAAGSKTAAKSLGRASEGGSVEVRRGVIECVLDNPKLVGQTSKIALALVGDADGEVRADVARALALAVTDKAGGKSPEADALAALAKDESREVRILAIRALAASGSAPKAAAESLPRAFESADESERLVILKAGQALGIGELVQLAAGDPSPRVRIAAIDTAIATKTSAAATINSALTDPDAAVRRAALERMAKSSGALSHDEIDRALALAVRDPDREIAVLALTTLARVGDPAAVGERLRRLADARSESERAMAATACGGLALTDAKAAIGLLEPMLHDPSHDVRVAMLPSLARAYALSRPPDDLGKLLAASEAEPTRRLAATAALLLQAASNDKRDGATRALADLAEHGPPLAQLLARTAKGLAAASAGGLEFLAGLVP